MAEKIASWLIPLPAGKLLRLLDPCCSEGKIGSFLGTLLNYAAWGCELFLYRAEKLAAPMDRCHSTAWESCSLIDVSVTRLWLNLPYDDDRRSNEMPLEMAFIKSTTPTLEPGGEPSKSN